VLRITTIVAAFAAGLLLAPSPAQAHVLKCDPWGKLTKAKHRCHLKQATHAHYAIRWGRKHSHLTGAATVKRNHRWLRRTMHRKISTYRVRVYRSRLWIPGWARSGLLCIHGYEGSWTDSGDPYWGGLQMDRSFMGSYAPGWLLRRGYADSWSPAEQMWVAYRAIRSGRGWHPWPNTARYCGLI
jgi:hypothetical protein